MAEFTAEFTYVLATDITFPHIDVYRRYEDGVQNGYRVNTHTDYVMYDTTANETYYDPATDSEVPYTSYYTQMYLPNSADFDNFTWVAVPRSSVDEDDIHGDVEEKPEVM